MSTDSLGWIIHSMKASFDFDAVQILWFCPENHHYYEIFREGYNQPCAESLHYDFPKTYPRGFTCLSSPQDMLPPSISESGEMMQPPFRKTQIYSKYLNKYGYFDGLSLELNSSNEYYGLIHFSSYQSNHFNQPLRVQIKNFRHIIECWMKQTLRYHDDPSCFLLFHHPSKHEHMFELIQAQEAAISQDILLNITIGLDQLKKFMVLHERTLFAVEVVSFPNQSHLISFSPVKPKPLSFKEMNVLSLLASGQTDKEIAHFLSVGERTIHSHISSILRKLNINNRVEAAVYAVMNAIILVHNAESLTQVRLARPIKSVQSNFIGEH